ncbi:MAG: hypothetical protein J6S58_05885 [Lentisphaeria bacterium]|nr:hypothetical protein [Lentisphaeria bacterium]
MLKQNIRQWISGVLFPLFMILVCGACNNALDLTPRMPSDLTIKELIRRMNRASDPKKEYFNCKSYRMRQTLSVSEGGVKDLLTLEVCFQAPDKLRTTTFRGEKPTVVEICNGGKAWSIDCGTGRIRSIPSGLPLELIRLYTKQATPSLDAAKIFRKVDIDMSVDEKGYKTYRLICDAGVSGIAPYVYYVNGHTFLTERIETIMYVGLHEYLYVSSPSDYKWFGNVRLPGSSTVKLMESTRISNITAFELNVEFPDHYFQPEIRRGRIRLPGVPEKKKVLPVSAKKKSPPAAESGKSSLKK